MKSMAGRIMPATIIGAAGLFLLVELWAAAEPGGLLTGPPGFDFDTYGHRPAAPQLSIQDPAVGLVAR